MLTNRTFWRGCSLDCATKYIFVSGFPELTFLLKNKELLTFANSIYLCYECKWDEKNTNDIHVKKLTWWGICPTAIHVIPIKYEKTIYDIGTEILKFQCLNCFKTRLFCKSIIPEDSKISRRDLSFASVKSRFKAIFKKVKCSTQYEIYRICRLSTK